MFAVLFTLLGCGCLTLCGWLVVVSLCEAIAILPAGRPVGRLAEKVGGGGRSMVVGACARIVEWRGLE